MLSLYVKAQTWQLPTIRENLTGGEEVGTDTYCFRENTYVVTGIESQARFDDLSKVLYGLGVGIPMQ